MGCIRPKGLGGQLLELGVRLGEGRGRPMLAISGETNEQETRRDRNGTQREGMVLIN
jgi:hypothetical protein